MTVSQSSPDVNSSGGIGSRAIGVDCRTTEKNEHTFRVHLLGS